MISYIDNQTQTRRYKKYLMPYFILILCITIMQYHAIPVWNEHLGNGGIFFSMSFELFAFWVWKHKLVLSGIVASIILIGAPLLSTAMPLFKEFQEISVQQKRIQLHEEALKRESDTLKNISQSSWAGMINKSRNNVQKSTMKVDVLLQESLGNQAWEKLAIMIIHVLGLFVIIRIQLHIYGLLRSYKQVDSRFLSTRHDMTIDRNKEVSLKPLAQKVYRELSRLWEQHDRNWNAVAEVLDITQSSINRTRNILDGKPDQASLGMLQKIERKLSEAL